jgi:RNA polymerase sigma-70 factor (ECF subfamily)
MHSLEALPVSEFLEPLVPRLYQFALRLTGDAHLAEDLTQETMLRAWDRRGQLRELQSARAWLFQIAANAWRDHCRRSFLRDGRRQELPVEPVSRAGGPAYQAEQRDEVRMVLEALDSLPPRQREVLYLAACEEMSIAQIAELLEISTDAAKANLSAARKQMRHRLRGRL